MTVEEGRRCRFQRTRSPREGIDNYLSLIENDAMSTRVKPAACCEVPNDPIPLPATEQERIVAMFKALADATRLDVFRLIAAQDAPICACDVVDRFRVSQPTISHHLKVLREAGLITVSRRGVWAYYAADPRGLALLRGSLDAFAPERLAVAS
jgi:ArsR family transcriptional regulator